MILGRSACFRDFWRGPLAMRLPAGPPSRCFGLIRAHVAEFSRPPRKLSLSLFPLFSCQRFVFNAVEFACGEFQGRSGGQFGWSPRHAEQTSPLKVLGQKPFDQRRKRTMVVSRCFFGSLF